MFFEKAMRSKISYTPKKYSKAHNNYLKFYDQKQESKHIIYLDTNNLFGSAIAKFLPISGSTWIDPKEFDLHNIPAIVPKDGF